MLRGESVNPIVTHMARILGVVLLSSMCLTGCVFVVAGGIGALGGYAISPDTVEGPTTRSQEELWDATMEIVDIMGKLVEQSPSRGELQAIINGARVTINVVPVNTTSAKLRVKARKAFLPKIDVAQDVYAKIIRQLEEE